MIKPTNDGDFAPASGTVRQDTTLRAQAQNVLRNAILDGYFKTGQKLVERELCELTGASRSILREALVNHARTRATSEISSSVACSMSVSDTPR